MNNYIKNLEHYLPKMDRVTYRIRVAIERQLFLITKYIFEEHGRTFYSFEVEHNFDSEIHFLQLITIFLENI